MILRPFASVALGWLAALGRGEIPPPGDPILVQLDPNRLPHNWRWLVNTTLAGNELWRILALFLSLLMAFIAGRVTRWFLSAAAARTKSHGQHLVATMFDALARSANFVALVLGLYVGVHFLWFNDTVANVSSTVVSILMTVAVGYVGYCLVGVVDEWLRQISEKTVSKLDDMLVPLVRKSLRGTIIILVLVQVATILSEKPVTSIIAGLGVGGLAVGLAAQDTIKNFFGSMMIFGDRPFEMGDDITVDGLTGSVEIVGFRSTRFRTPDGHLVTIPNGELANKTIINVSKRRNLMRKLNLALAFDLAPDKVQLAIALVKDILADHEGLNPAMPPRIFFNDFAPSALNLSITYWYHPPDWWKFVAFNERVNLEILRCFRHREIAFAYPTQAIQLLGRSRESPPAKESPADD